MKDINLSMIEKAKNGDNDAFETIFMKYTPIVLKQWGKYYLRDYELEDWLQEGRIVCYKSLQRYNSDVNVTFGLFFKINFERWIISAIRYQQAKKRKINHPVESLEQRIEERGDYNEPFEFEYKKDIRLEYIFVRESLEDLSKQLSSFEIKVYQHILEGTELADIAENLNVEEQKVIGGYSRVKRKLKKQLDV